MKRTTKDYGYLASAVNKGVVTGITPSKFDPNGYLTRQQAAAILVRALGLEGKLLTLALKQIIATMLK